MPSPVGVLVNSEETSRVQRMQSLGNLVDSVYLINSFVSLFRRGVTLPEAEASGPSRDSLCWTTAAGNYGPS